MANDSRIERVYDLTDSQQAILARSLGDPSTAYVVQKTFTVKGRFDTAAAEEAAKMLSRKHEILRASIYVSGEGITKHVILRDRTVEVRVASADEALTEQLELAELTKTFDLQHDSLLRLLIVKDHAGIVRVVWTFHHIILDGWSVGVLVNDFFEFYDALVSGDTPSTAASPSFGDHVEALRSKGSTLATEFWDAELSGHRLDAAHPYSRTAGADNAVHDAVTHQLDDESSRLMADLIVQSGLTASTILQFAWGVLLAKERSVDDILLGRVVSGRDSTREGFHEAVGMYVNTVPTRITLRPDDTVLSAMRRMALIDEASCEFEHVPWSAIRRRFADSSGELAGLFVLENYHVREADWHSNGGRDYEVRLEDHPEYSEFPLTLGVTVFDATLFNFGYDPSLYTRAQVERIAARYVHLLATILEYPTRLLNELSAIPPSEKDELLSLSCGPRRAIPMFSAADRLSAHIRDFPERPALVQGKHCITYGELGSWIVRIGQVLSQWSLPENSRVVVVGDNSIETVASMLGVVCSGHSFILVDAASPKERLSTILRESDAEGIVISKASLTVDVALSKNVAVLQDYIPAEGQNAVDHVHETPLPFDPDREIYTIFTSGSTGVPKGVPIREEGLINLVEALRETVYSDGDLTKVGLIASIAFDASLQQILGALLNGLTLDILPQGLKSNPDAFWSYLGSHQIDAIDGTPSFWRMMLQELDSRGADACPSIFIIGGERMSGSLVRQFTERLPKAVVVNAYGLSETTVDSTLFVCHPEDANKADVPVGTPIRNTSIYVLDDSHRLRGFGLIGDVHISGVGVTSGYLNPSDRKGTSIATDPRTGSRMLKTGDLGYWDQNGQLCIVGRSDDQVKVNGYRIEPSEIEHALLALRHIEQAAVVAVEEDERVRLVAFVVAEPSLPSDEIKQELSASLPAYLIPQRYVSMESIPTTVSGKIDRAVLRHRLARGDHETPSGDVENQPISEAERILLGVVGKVLKRPDVSLLDDFFALGGDSIEAIRVVALLSDYSVTVSDFLKYPVLGDLAREMRLRLRTIDQQAVVGAVRLFPIHRQLWRVTAPDNFHHFNQSLLFDVAGDIDVSDLTYASARLVNHHDALRASFGYGAEHANFLPEGQVAPLVLEFAVSESELQEPIRQVQASLSPEKGLVAAMALLRTEHKTHVLVVVHHAVCDAVSLRVIAEDLETLLTGRLSGQVAELPKRTDSLRTWETALTKSDMSARFDSGRSFWPEQLPEQRTTVLRRRRLRPPHVSETSVTDAVVDAVRVTASLRSGLERNGLSLQAILTAAFADAHARSIKQHEVSLCLEGHGRQLDGSDLNVSRTVGWFTAVHMLRLERSPKRAIDLQYCSDVQARIVAIPDGGLGYAWRYGDGLPAALTAKINAMAPIFNYLGDFNSRNEGALLVPSTHAPTGDVAGSVLFENPLIANVSVTDGRIHVSVRHHKGFLDRAAVGRLLRRFEVNLRTIGRLLGGASFGVALTANLSAIGRSGDEVATVINPDGDTDVFAFPPAMLRVAYMPLYEALFAPMTKYRVHVLHLQQGETPEWKFADYVRSVGNESRPFAFVGYSGGANIAYETSVSLESDGLTPRYMLFIDGFKWQTGLDFAVLDDDTVDSLVEKFLKESGFDDQNVDLQDFMRVLESEREDFLAEGRRYHQYAISHQNRVHMLGRTKIVNLLSEDRIVGAGETRMAWQEISALPVDYINGVGNHLSMLANTRNLGDNMRTIAKTLDEWLEQSEPGRPIVSARGISRTYGVGDATVHALSIPRTRATLSTLATQWTSGAGGRFARCAGRT
jgi:amino acid adenylation domain-containing protein